VSLLSHRPTGARASEPAAARTLHPRIAAILVGLLIPLLLGELLLRFVAPTLAAPRLPLTYDHQAIDQLVAGDAYVSYDATLGWLPTPNVDRVRGSRRYRHNEDGLRAERGYDRRPPVGVQRLLAYGDSYTYCEEVRIGDCWTTDLERLLPDTEVLNLGVPGYAPDQAWLRYQRDGASWNGCAVLIGSLVENVNRVVNRFRPFYVPETGIALPKPRFTLDQSQLALLPNPVERPDQLHDPAWVEQNLGPRDHWYFPGIFAGGPLDRLELSRLARTAQFRSARRDAIDWTPEVAARMYQSGNEPFEVLTAVLVGFSDEVRANGATPVVVIFPLSGEVLNQRDRAQKTHAPLLERLAQHGIATVDLTDAFGQQARRADISRLFEGHYTPFGNELAARTLARELPELTAGTCSSASTHRSG
jgi:hypothetical protein